MVLHESTLNKNTNMENPNEFKESRYSNKIFSVNPYKVDNENFYKKDGVKNESR